MDTDFSICIATYLRPLGLARLLDSLERLELPSGRLCDALEDRCAVGGRRVREDGNFISVGRVKSQGCEPRRFF
jgi:hypothetical protein